MLPQITIKKTALSLPAAFGRFPTGEKRNFLAGGKVSQVIFFWFLLFIITLLAADVNVFPSTSCQISAICPTCTAKLIHVPKLAFDIFDKTGLLSIAKHHGGNNIGQGVHGIFSLLLCVVLVAYLHQRT
jgi:hypothetical protein